MKAVAATSSGTLLNLYLMIVLCRGFIVDRWLSLTMDARRRPVALVPATHTATDGSNDENNNDDGPAYERNSPGKGKFTYELGLGKNKPVKGVDELDGDYSDQAQATFSERPGTASARDNDMSKLQWNVAESVRKPGAIFNVATNADNSSTTKLPTNETRSTNKRKLPPVKTRRMIARDEKSRKLRNALWDETHFSSKKAVIAQAVVNAAPLIGNMNNDSSSTTPRMPTVTSTDGVPPYPTAFYADIDLSIPESVYSEYYHVDLVWDLLRWEAYEQATREPLLVSFLHSTILNHPSLESSLAFLLANRLQSPGMMISTQLQSIILEALQHNPVFRRSLRADIMAVRDRDPACSQLPDAFLYFKGFHALQSYRVAHSLWLAGKGVLAQFLQSQVSQIFQIDIHPNATIGSGILLDHGTGVVIGSTVCFCVR